ncbi:MarR family transcriptional regulator [Marinobacter sp. BGYM27]|uniref:MarR family winged helix-turn-helix transcriptional regulator n=1 Tax=unclassified Marinobacter TaxID=83889 RepID=UPI0021A4C078|nr:MarR family transcriptional regulator [Marinobacter sp. BGYM27]
MSPHDPATPSVEPFLSLHQSLKPSLGAALGRVHRLWRDAITAAVAPLGMTESRWAVMVHLAKIGEGATQQALAKALCIEMPSLTRTLNQLEQQALIERRRDPEDGRAHRLWFTPEGKQVVVQLEDRIHGVRFDIYDGLSDIQLDAFAEVLIHMEANLREHLQIPGLDNGESGTQ